MENNRLGYQVKKLKIGDYIIDCIKGNWNKTISLPYSMLAFYQPYEKQEADFVLDFNHSIQETHQKLLFGDSNFDIPLQIWECESGNYDWIIRERTSDRLIKVSINQDWNHFTVYEDQMNDEGETFFHEFGSILSYALLKREGMVLHGVVMEYQGKGILVMATSGMGKTTHTRVWRDAYNALILNGDRCLCRRVNNQWYAYGSPWSGSSGEYINRKVPIDYLINLERGENQVFDMNLFDSTIYLMQRIFMPKWYCDLQLQAMDLVEDLAKKTPMVKLECKIGIESVDALKNHLGLE